MMRYKGFGLSILGLCALSAAAHAQVYSTGFDGVDIVNGSSTTATYASPNFAATYQSNTDPTAAGPTAPVASQNGWTSNDATGPIGHGVVSGTNANQINGGTTFVGALTDANNNPVFGGTLVAAIGGIYSPSAQTPAAVPSTGSAGIVNLFHPVTIPSIASRVSLNTDFILFSDVSAGAGTTEKDTFSFVLANGGTTVMSFNMVPTSPASNQANVTATGATTTTATFGVALNAQYHLRITLLPGTTPTYTITLTGSTGIPQTLTGNLASAITSVTQVGAIWNLTDKATNANGGLTGGGDSFLAFDNFAVTVPEPSTYAMLAVGGLLGLVGARRWHGRQA